MVLINFNSYPDIILKLALIGGISLSTLTFQMRKLRYSSFIKTHFQVRNAQRNSRLTLSIFSGVSGFTLGGSFGAVKATDALLALEDSELADHYRKMYDRVMPKCYLFNPLGYVKKGRVFTQPEA